MHFEYGEPTGENTQQHYKRVKFFINISTIVFMKNKFQPSEKDIDMMFENLIMAQIVCECYGFNTVRKSMKGQIAQRYNFEIN